MELSVLAGISGIEVLRDGSFQSVGCPGQNKPQQLSYLSKCDRLSPTLSNSAISCLITTKELASKIPPDSPVGVAISDHPVLSLLHIHNHLAENTGFYGTRKKTTIIGKNTCIHPTAVVSGSNVIIGKNCTIGPNVTIYEGTEIGDHVTIGPGTIIGSERSGPIRVDDEYVTVIRTGEIRIHQNVNIHANCCVASPFFGGFTDIGDSVQIDNLVHIGRGTRVGTRTMIVALAVIGDNVEIGSDVWIGPGVVVSDNIAVGNNAFVTLGSVVMEDVSCGNHVTGNYAIEHKKFLAFLKTIR